MHLMIYFQLNDLEIGKGYNLNSEGCNLAWYHHLTQITCVQKLRELRQKLDVLRVQTGPSLSNYKGFRQKLICYKDISCSMLISTQDFFPSNMQHSKPHTEISTLSDFVCYF